MKVGFFGNNNNYPLALAEAMRRAGHEVLFVVNKAPPLHRPESRDPGAYGAGYPDWMLDAAHISEWDFMSLQPAVGPLLDRLASCDALVLNDLGPSLLPLLDRPAITFLTGSDLDYYADRALPDLRMQGTSVEYRAGAAGRAHRRLLEDFVVRQRQGLRDSVAINWALPGLFPASEALLAECGVSPQQIFNLQMADLGRITAAPAPDNPVLRVFCGTRLTWKLPIAAGRSPLDYKGTDVMVRGVGQFCRTTGKRVELCLVQKGMHIDETRDLVAAEGLSDQTVWLSEMPLQELWRQFLASDVIVEQLGGSIISMVAMDAMACGRPLIGNARPEVPTVFSAAGSPVCQAQTPDEVCAQLVRLAADPAERHAVGRAGRAFVEAHFSPARGAAACLQRLAAAPVSRTESRAWVLRALAEARALALQAEVQVDELRHEGRAHGSQLEQVRHSLATEAAQSDHLKALLALRDGQEQRLLAVILAARRRDGMQWRALAGPFAADGGLGWSTNLRDLAAWADGDEPSRSGLLLFEGDRLLGPAHSAHDDIRRLGGGRFSHWRTSLYFSTTDGSDPNRNGRSYAIVLPTPAGNPSKAR